MEDFDMASWRRHKEKNLTEEKKVETILMDWKKWNYMVLIWEIKTLDLKKKNQQNQACTSAVEINIDNK